MMFLKLLKCNKFRKKKHYIFDSLFFAITVGFVILGYIFDWHIFDMNNISVDTFGNVISITVSVLPLVIQILSIILSLNDKPYLGVDMVWYRDKRGNYLYSYLEMLLISLSLIALALLSVAFKFVLLIYTIAFISIIYSFIFVIEEIPFILRNEKYYCVLIQKAFNDKDYDDKLDIILVNLFSLHGLEETANILKKKKEDILDISLFQKIIYTINKQLKNIGLYPDKIGKDELINVDKLIDQTYVLLDSVISFKTIDIISVYSNNESNINEELEDRIFSQPVSDIFIVFDHLHIATNDSDYYKESYNKISFAFCYALASSNINIRKFAIKLLNLLTIKSTYYCNLYFTKQLIGKNVLHYQYKNSLYYLYFQCIYYYEYLNHIDYRNKDNNLLVNELNNFYKFKIEGISLFEFLERELRNLSFNSFISLYNNLFMCYNVSYNYTWEMKDPDVRGIASYSGFFDENSIIDFILLCMTSYFHFNIQDIDPNLFISEDAKILFARRIKVVFTEDNIINSSFFNELKIKNWFDYVKSIKDNNPLMKFAQETITEYNIKKNKTNGTDDEDENQDETSESKDEKIAYKEVLNLREQTNRYFKYSKSMKYYSIYIESNDIDKEYITDKSILNLYLNNAFDNLKRRILSIINNNPNLNKINKEQIKREWLDSTKLLGFNYEFWDYCHKNKIDFNFYDKEDFDLKNGIILLNDAVTINYKFSHNKIEFKELTDEQINKIIDSKPISYNDLYYVINKDGEFYYTRDKYFEYIKENVRRFSIEIKYYVVFKIGNIYFIIEIDDNPSEG